MIKYDGQATLSISYDTHAHCNIEMANNVRGEVDEERLRISRKSTTNLEESDKRFANIAWALLSELNHLL